MGAYNKNISAVIIVTCMICIVISLFLPKRNNAKDIRPKYSSESHISLKPISPYGSLKSERIAVIRLEGVISDSQGGSVFKDLTSSNYVLEIIKKATQDPQIKGIVLRINSPGGTVAASQELYKAVLIAKKRKPVVVTLGDIAASGGYYVASASDVIFANPGTITGSIGVITSYLNFQQLLSMIGIEGVTVKSGKYKDIGSPLKPLSEEERKILQSLLDDSYKQFIKAVANGRQKSTEEISKLAQGLIYTGNQAKKLGLVDKLGDYYQAIKYAQILVKERFPELQRRYKKRDLPIEETWKEVSLLDMLIGSFNNNSIQSKLINERITKSFIYSRFQPLWLLE